MTLKLTINEKTGRVEFHERKQDFELVLGRKQQILQNIENVVQEEKQLIDKLELEIDSKSFTATRVAITVINLLAKSWDIPIIYQGKPSQLISPNYKGEANITRQKVVPQT